MTYSIIIPHKDIPDLLMRCLHSIPVREDIQVIVVDDNSKDADSYLSTYKELSRPYLEFYSTKEWKGAGYARNVGLTHANGKWIIFADADDFFTDQFETILDEYQDDDADVIYFEAIGRMSDNISMPSRRGSYTKLKDNQDPFYYRVINRTVCCKLIKRELIEKNELRFSEVRCLEDVYFGIRMTFLSQNPKIIHKEMCVFTERVGSLTYGIMHKEKLSLKEAICRSFENIKCFNYYGSRRNDVGIVYGTLVHSLNLIDKKTHFIWYVRLFKLLEKGPRNKFMKHTFSGKTSLKAKIYWSILFIMQLFITYQNALSKVESKIRIYP